jgi:regulator of RNase E activity RraA
MSNWTATNELRFVDKTIKEVGAAGIIGRVFTVRTLQQKYESDQFDDYGRYITEWRDVPVVEEE